MQHGSNIRDFGVFNYLRYLGCLPFSIWIGVLICDGNMVSALSWMWCKSLWTWPLVCSWPLSLI